MGDYDIQSLVAGQWLAKRYLLQSPIGAGSMAEVWTAMDDRHDRQVAVKVLSELLAPSSRAQERFAREVAAIGRIRHGNVVRLLDHGSLPDGRPFLVMEYHRGESLASHLERKGPLGAKAARSLGLQILDGLAAAHANSIIHRDLKPANLQLVERSGGKLTVKILDFGVARIRDIACEEGSQARLTATGTMLGSPRYGPLEVARGSIDVDERSDLFSVGAVLYHVVAGRPPFAGKAIGEIMRNIANHRIVALTRARPNLPSSLVSVIERAMAQNPGDRYSNALEMRDALVSLSL